MSVHHTPHETASIIGINPATLRRWSEYHAAYLSSGAQANSGQPRRFTGRDLEVLRHCKALRDQGRTVSNINEQLAGLTFAEIEADSQILVSPEDTAIAAQTAPNELQSIPAMHTALFAMQGQIDAVERAQSTASRQVRDGVFMFAAGVIVGLLLMFMLILLASMYGGA